MSLPSNVDVSSWSIPEVKRWLNEINCGQYANYFGDKYIDGEGLLALTSDSSIKLFPHISASDRLKIINAVSNYRAQSNHCEDDQEDDFSDDEYWCQDVEDEPMDIDAPPVRSSDNNDQLSYVMAISTGDYQTMDEDFYESGDDGESCEIYDAVADETPQSSVSGYRAPPRPPKPGAPEPYPSDNLSSIPLIDAPSPPRANNRGPPSKPQKSNDSAMPEKPGRNFRAPAPIPSTNASVPARPNKPLPSANGGGTSVSRLNKPLPTPGDQTPKIPKHTPPKIPPTNRGPPVPERPPDTDGEDYEEVNTQIPPQPEAPVVKHNFNKPLPKPFESTPARKPFEPKRSALDQNKSKELPKPSSNTPVFPKHPPPQRGDETPPSHAPQPPPSKNKPLPTPNPSPTSTASPISPKRNGDTHQGGSSVAALKDKFGGPSTTPSKPAITTRKPAIASRMAKFDNPGSNSPQMKMNPAENKSKPSIQEQIQQAQRNRGHQQDKQKPLPVKDDPPVVKKTTTLPPKTDQTRMRPEIPSTATLPTRNTVLGEAAKRGAPPVVPPTSRPPVHERPLPTAPSSASVSSRGSNRSETSTGPPELPSRPAPKGPQSNSVGRNGAGDSDEDPYLYTYHWFHGHIPRAEATKRLKERHAPQDGYFLIRNSDKDASKPFTVDVMYQGRDFHVSIRLMDDARYCLGDNTKNAWKSIPEFVDYFKTNRLLLKSKDINGSTVLKEFPYRR